MNSILKNMKKKSINKLLLNFKTCPLCKSKQRVFAKYPYKNRYSEQISDYLKIDENILIKKIKNMKCKNCNLIYKSSWFKKEFYKSAFDKLAPTHPRGWETISGRFSKNNLRKEIRDFTSSVSNNKDNRGAIKRGVISIVDSIQINSSFKNRFKEKYLKEIHKENLGHINKNKNKIIKLLDEPARFKRFTNFSDDKLFSYIKKNIGNIKYYGEIGCPLWGMLNIAKNHGCNTTFIKGDEFYFWGKKCKNKKNYCFSKIKKTTDYIKSSIDSYRGNKIDFLGVFQYLDHLPDPMKFMTKVFSISKSAGFILEDEGTNLVTAKKFQKVNTGIPVQHFSGWDKNTMKFIAKKFNKKIKSDFSDIKISGNIFFLLY